MKKRLISCLIAFCILCSLCSSVYAVDSSNDSLESDLSVQIEQIISQFYFDQPGQYAVGGAITIFNADTESVYYIIPVFCNQECVGVVELDVAGNITLTDGIVLYTEISEFSSSSYLLYTYGGVVYAESQAEVIELYDSGFDIPVNNDFALLSYSEKVALAETCSQTAASSLNISAIIEETELSSIIASDVSPLALVPTLEAEECAITNFVTQNGYNICWSACIATIANYMYGFCLTAEGIARAAGHDYTDENYTGAYLNEIEYAFSLYGLTYTTSSGKLGWEDVKENVVEDRPFAVRIHSGTLESGHMLTCYGYSCQYGDSESSSSSRYIKVWDPNGYKLTFAYNSSSFNLYGYSWTWTHTLTGTRTS